MPRRRASDLAGFLAIDKPAGWTSHDVVARVRSLSGIRRVGHAGTLDPFATGLLIVGVGRATRLIQYVQNTAKTYETTLRLGAETDTHDTEGTVTSTADINAWPSRDAVVAVLAGFTGEIDQIPPAHSAVHVDGKRAYERARAGEAFDLPTRAVTIHELAIAHYTPPDLGLRVRCSTGTYIRSLARDIGRALGTYAYCEVLRRTASGSFEVSDAVELDQLTRDNFRELWPALARPPDAAVMEFDPISLTERQTTAWYHGQSLRDGLSAPPAATNTPVRVYAASGNFAGLGRFETENELRPVLVFHAD